MQAPPTRPLKAFARGLQRVAMASARRPIAASAWRLAYAVLARAVALALVVRRPGAGVWLRGGLAARDIVPGVSDIDLVVVVPGDPARPGPARLAMARRWRRLGAALPPLARLVNVFPYERAELESAVKAPAPLAGGPLFSARPALDDALWLRTRPGLEGPTAGWRRIAGTATLPVAPGRDVQRTRVAGWLELQWWWRHAIGLCLRPDAPHVPYLLAKLVAETARVWLRVELGESHDRREALRKLSELAPEEAPTARLALRMLDRPGLGHQAAPLLAATARLSGLAAAHVGRAAASAGSTHVRLVGTSREGELPLVDARALVVPPRLDERVTVAPGGLGEPAAVAAAASGTPPGGPYRALREGELLLIPTDEVWAHGFLRTLQCPATDPVTFALLAGREEAAFPELAGWSARCIAARAVAEHAARLELPGAPRERAEVALSAARAALLAEALAAGDPALALSLTGIVTAWSAVDGDAGALAADASAAIEAGEAVADSLAGELVRAAQARVEQVRAARGAP